MTAHLLPLALEAITSFAAYEVLQDAMLESGWWDVRLEAYRWDYKNRNGDRMALPRGIAAVLLFGEWSTARWPLVEAHEVRRFDALPAWYTGASLEDTIGDHQTTGDRVFAAAAKAAGAPRRTMMPIWDEEWWVRNSPACTDDIYCEEAKYIFTGLRAIGQPGFEEARDRAKLAAAAPAMARLLLELEWAGDRGIGLCPACGSGKPWLAFDDQDGEPKGGHAPDCTWLAVMRAAGVRE